METDKASRRLARVLGLPGLVVLGFLAMVPAIFAWGSSNEGIYYPVVIPLVHDNGTPDFTADDYLLPIVAEEFPSPDAYVDVFVQFEKVRNCAFLIEERFVRGEIVRVNRSLSWYRNGERLRVTFTPESADLPTSRPLGSQASVPLRIHGVRTTEATTPVVAHRCHPLWLTYSQFYP